MSKKIIVQVPDEIKVALDKIKEDTKLLPSETVRIALFNHLKIPYSKMSHGGKRKGKINENAKIKKITEVFPLPCEKCKYAVIDIMNINCTHMIDGKINYTRIGDMEEFNERCPIKGEIDAATNGKEPV